MGQAFFPLYLVGICCFQTSSPDCAAPGAPSAAQLHEALAAHYAGSEWVTVEPATPDGKLDALALQNTNKMELRVFANEAHGHAVLIARLDNLGKGASGAAVQNLQLMLGL